MLTVASALYFVGHYIGYGSLTRNCVYTEQVLTVPEHLSEGEIVVVKDAYLATGHDKEYSCLKEFRNIDKEIVGPESINNITIGRKYFTSKGLEVTSLKKGEVFRAVSVIAVTKHGISTIDSGSGPIYYLVMKDQNNTFYQIATVSMGLNDSDLFLSFVDGAHISEALATSSVKLISWESFDTVPDYLGQNALKFTGILKELPVAYVTATEPGWKKLADRLERGEKFLIMIDIDLLDDKFNEIKLSNDQSKRQLQVSQMQDELLKKIPKNITLNGVENNASWPYITLEANLPLLNYLVDNQATLKIKSISELQKMP